MSEKVTLEMTCEHARVVMDACEMLMRMKLGQTSQPTELMLGGICGRYDVKEFCLRRDMAQDILRAFLRATGNPEGVEKDEVEQMAYEVFGSIRYALWCADHPGDTDSWSVASQPPISESGLGIPKCKVLKEG